MNRLNPFSKIKIDNDRKKEEDSKKNKASILKARKDVRKKFRKHGRNFIRNFRTELKNANTVSENSYKAYITSIKIGEDAMKEREDIK